ncbi:MAG TPA: Gfo/Idh/MocA family oxidoreductase [Bacteroidia bacterium]|jgi:predicted dehydrogenase|nr:Gfo/Idh/MocA family oxidoreductase [Bacteroidia bacterium]
MYSVVIVGAGNIGSRHLQSFAKSKQKISIVVIDPFQASLDVCKTRWDEANTGDKLVDVNFKKNYSGITKEVDLAIISTNSEHRYNALEEVLKHCTCKNILLEKFLFSTEEEYTKANSLINNHSCNVYVNLVRRTFDCYKWTHKELAAEKGNLTMQVVGNNWGMASNSIHFIDLFCYLSNDVISNCDFADANSTQLLDSKREGYIEFLGHLVAESNHGSKLAIACTEGIYDKINLTIKKGNTIILVEEKGDEITVHNVNNGATQKFPYPYQSQLTLKYFIEFVEGKPSLVTYKESMGAHISFLHAVKNLLSATNNKQIWKIT